MEPGTSSGGSSGKSDKPLSIDKAAFLLLRVRRVFKKKIALKKDKDKNQDTAFQKSEPQAAPKSKKSRIPPLIRSRTVPAIIVPFSILQAQLVKATGGCVGVSSGGSSIAGPSSSAASANPLQSKSDFSTPGVDFVQFLTGSGSPSSSIAGTPPSRRELHFLGLSNPSIYRESPTDSSWNINANSTGNVSSVSPISLECNGNSTFIGNLSYPGSTSSGSSGSKGLSRIARLLNSQIPKSQQQHAPAVWSPSQPLSPWPGSSAGLQVPGTDSAFALATPRLPRRRRSLENEDLSSCRPRAVSIDSLIRGGHLAPPNGSDGSKGVSPKRFSTSSAGPTLSHRDRTDMKVNEAFVAAVEQGNVNKVKSILETNDIDINSLTADGLTLLDVSVIQKNKPMVRLLLENGATENQYWRKESINDLLQGMVQEAEKKSEDLMSRLLKCSTFGNLSPAQLKELEKEFHMWEKRYKKFRKMRTEYTQIRPPDAPGKVMLDVISSTSVKVRLLQEDEAVKDANSIITKYKIEWSTEEDFKSTERIRSMEIFDLRKMETVLNDLKSGTRYYFRVACGNCTGYGAYSNCTPASVIPSSWRDTYSQSQSSQTHPKGRYNGKSIIFDQIFHKVRRARPEYASEIKTIEFPKDNKLSSFGPNHCNNNSSSNIGLMSTGNNSTQQQKKNQKMISIKQLFASAPKFQKNFKRGVFLSCVMYSEDKLLVTTEEFLPTIEIDESFPSSLHNDFHWLLKVACTWEDVKSLKQDMEKSGSASTFHFRLKLLQAASAMQNALGISDLGRLYYKTIRDKSNSVLVISTINYMRTTKMISSLNVRWAPLTKMNNRKFTDEFSDVLINSIQEQILYHQVSNIPLGKGLYLGYLKLASSVDLLKIVVPEKTPNILPHAKIRDNPHISSEEWLLIQKMVKSKSSDSLNCCETNNNTDNEGDDESRRSGGSQNNQHQLLGSTTSSSEQLLIVSTTSSENNNCLSGGGSNSSIGCPTPTNEFTEAQEIFRSQINSAMKKLFSFLEIPYHSSMTHRLYNTEVVELSHSVSMIVVFPALENVCLVAGQSDKLLQRNDLIPLPIQIFEMIHLNTYQKEFITRYARLSAILEVDTILAQHNQREAFSTEEIAQAKQRLAQLQDFQSQLDSNWKNSRWVIDLVTSSRDKSWTLASVGALLLTEFDLKTSSESIASVDTAGLGRIKNPIESQFLGLHSKSDQQLMLGGFGSTSGSPSGGLKFSRSENQLASLGIGDGDSKLISPSGSDSMMRSSPHHHHRLIPGIGRKVSVPIHQFQNTTDKNSPPLTKGAQAESEKLQFTSTNKIFSSHSQSDSTITSSVSNHGENSNSQTGGVSGTGTTSLHNLYRHSSSSQIIVPNVVVSPSNEVSAKNILTRNVTSSALPIGIVRNKEPPPVPPRRSLPPQHQQQNNNKLFEAFDPIPAPPSSSSIIPSVQVNLVHPPPPNSTWLPAPSIPIKIGPSVPSPTSAIIRVFAAYACGLCPGTSVKLQITNTTTAKQVVELVVKQLNSEVQAKGLREPVYESAMDFCLVSVIGARERCFRNDFKPLQLQNPWKSGRLFVRKKSEITAAIDMNSRRDIQYT